LAVPDFQSFFLPMLRFAADGEIVKMGYGGSIKDACQAIGRSGDEGIWHHKGRQARSGRYLYTLRDQKNRYGFFSGGVDDHPVTKVG
jgi:restriction endonuclease Mrr